MGLKAASLEEQDDTFQEDSDRTLLIPVGPASVLEKSRSLGIAPPPRSRPSLGGPGFLKAQAKAVRLKRLLFSIATVLIAGITSFFALVYLTK